MHDSSVRMSEGSPGLHTLNPTLPSIPFTHLPPTRYVGIFESLLDDKGNIVIT